MATLTFDTYQLIKELKESGFNEIQAEGLSTAFKETQDSQFETLAKKSDIKELRLEIQKLESELKGELKEVKGDLKRLESELKSEFKLIKWVLALIVTVILLPTLKELFS